LKTFARELIWFFIALVLATPLAFLFSYSSSIQPEMEQLSTNEEVFEMEFFIIGFIVGFILTYFMRAIIWAVSRYLIPKEA